MTCDTTAPCTYVTHGAVYSGPLMGPADTCGDDAAPHSNRCDAHGGWQDTEDFEHDDHTDDHVEPDDHCAHCDCYARLEGAA